MNKVSVVLPLLFLIICNSEPAFSKGEFTRQEVYPSFGVSSMVVRNSMSTVEAGILYGEYVSGHGMIGAFGVRTVVEAGMVGDDAVLGAKAAYEMAALILLIRPNLAVYTDLKGKTNLTFIPEVGFTAGGFIDVSAGWNLLVWGDKITNGIFRLSLTCTLIHS